MTVADEKKPTNKAAFRYEAATDWPRLPSIHSQSAWKRGGILVTSSVSASGLQGLTVWHLGISSRGQKPTDDLCRRVLEDFELAGAAEIMVATSGAVGRARHFELATEPPIDPTVLCPFCRDLVWPIGTLGPEYAARITTGTGHHPACRRQPN